MQDGDELIELKTEMSEMRETIAELRQQLKEKVWPPPCAPGLKTHPLTLSFCGVSGGEPCAGRCPLRDWTTDQA